MLSGKKISQLFIFFLVLFLICPHLQEITVKAESNVPLLFTDSGQRLGSFEFADPGYIAVGDLNNDGFLDLVLDSKGNGTILEVYLNDGTGNFTKTSDSFPVTSNPNPLWNFGIVLCDFNRDGFLDIGTADAWRGVNIYLNLKNGHFTWSQAILVPEINEVKGIDAADIDHDGDYDIVFGGHNGYSGLGDRIYLNDGNGHFSDSGQRISNELVWATAFGDLNNDGYADYVSINRYGEHAAKIHVNNGSGIFDRTIDLPTTQTDDSMDLRLVDLNMDGLLDIVIANSINTNFNTTSKVFFNRGNFNFELVNDTLGRVLPWTQNHETKSVEVVDIDNDGYYEIILGNWNGNNTFYRNNGTELFTQMSTEIPSNNTQAIKAADVNNDGFVDLIVGGASDGYYKVYLNNGQGLIKKPAPPLPINLNSNVTKSNCVLTWTPQLNLSSDFSNSLTYNIRIGTQPGSNDIVSGVSAFGQGHLGNALSFEIKGLQAGTYYWSVQTVTPDFQKSEWTQDAQFTILPDATPTPTDTSTPLTGGLFSLMETICVLVTVIAIIAVVIGAYTFRRRRKK